MNATYQLLGDDGACRASQLDTTYWLPWYNNVDLDTQLRFANVSDCAQPPCMSTSVAGDDQAVPSRWQPGASTRKSFAGVNDGPVKIVSDHEHRGRGAGDLQGQWRQHQLLRDDGACRTASWTPPTGCPGTTTWIWIPSCALPMSANSTATVHVSIGGHGDDRQSLHPGCRAQSTRKSFAGINNGPVKIVSNHEHRGSRARDLQGQRRRTPASPR